MTDSTINILSFAGSLLAIVAYHLYLRRQLRHNPAYTIQAVNADARVSWVEKVMKDPAREILAVQTLRNSTMAATFLASTSVLLIMGALSMLQNADSLGNLFNTLHSEALGHTFGEIKLLLLLVDFFWAFFCFSLAIRMYNHIGFLINSSNPESFCPAPHYVARLLNRGGSYYSLGMRAYYLSVPLVFWLFGPYYLAIATVGTVVALYHVDRAPDTGMEPALTPPRRNSARKRQTDDVPRLHVQSGKPRRPTDHLH